MSKTRIAIYSYLAGFATFSLWQYHLYPVKDAAKQVARFWFV